MSTRLPPDLQRLWRRLKNLGTKIDTSDKRKIAIGLLKEIHDVALKYNDTEMAKMAKAKWQKLERQ